MIYAYSFIQVAEPQDVLDITYDGPIPHLQPGTMIRLGPNPRELLRYQVISVEIVSTSSDEDAIKIFVAVTPAAIQTPA